MDLSRRLRARESLAVLPMYRLGHPEKQLFLLLQKNNVWVNVSQTYFILF